MITLKVESFAGRKFRDFANFFVDRESLYPRNLILALDVRKSLSPGTDELILLFMKTTLVLQTFLLLLRHRKYNNYNISTHKFITN